VPRRLRSPVCTMRSTDREGMHQTAKGEAVLGRLSGSGVGGLAPPPVACRFWRSLVFLCEEAMRGKNQTPGPECPCAARDYKPGSERGR